MKISHLDWTNVLEISENEIPIIIKENKEDYRIFLQSIYRQMYGEEGLLVVSTNKEEIKFSKEVDIISDYINIDINNKKNLNKLYLILKSKSIEEIDDYAHVSKQISEYIEKLIYDEDFNLVQNRNIEIEDILKGVNLSFDYDSENLLDMLIEYIIISERILGIKVFFLVNLKIFFTKEEIINIYNQLLLSKIKFIVLESTYSEKIDIREKIFIFDEDLCEI